jgi:hypothetical protein
LILKRQFETITTLSPQNFRPIGSAYHTNFKKCGISTREVMLEQGSVQGFIMFSALQWQVEKYVFEYFSFDNVKYFS